MPKTDTRETMVNVKEATGTEAPSSEFVRQGLVAIQAVNRGLNRMQAELARLGLTEEELVTDFKRWRKARRAK